MGSALVKISAALAGVSRLCVESAPFIYLVERHPAYVGKMRVIFTLIDQGTVIGISSVITLTEVLTQPIKARNTEVEKAYRSILSKSENFTLLPVRLSTAERAASLRAKYNLRTPDALQVATALESGCQAFLTNDRGLLRITETRILVLDDLELEIS